MQQDAFKTLKIIHLGITAGLLMFLIVFLVLLGTGQVNAVDPSLERTFQAVAAVVSVTLLLIGFNIFRRKIMEARNSPASGEERMNQYRAACIMWWAMIEGPGLLSVIGYFMTGNYAFVALAGFHVLVLLLFMPRKENIIVLLKLNPNEVAKLEGKN